MSQDLFKTINATIRKERLYADIDLMREDIAKRFGIGRHRLNDLLSTYADGMSFPQYINAIRMEEAYILLTDHPEMTIAEVARQVGFTAPICVSSSSAVTVLHRWNTVQVWYLMWMSKSEYYNLKDYYYIIY